MKSVMTHAFSNIPKAEIQRSTFDRSHGHKTTFDAGYLIPIYVDEALPGDTFNLKMNFFARVATLLYPLMDNLYLESFFFAVPNRLLWTHWKAFMGEKTGPNDGTSYSLPYLTNRSSNQGDIMDYMGLPAGVGGSNQISALPMRAYALIYQEWFKDENLIDNPTIDFGDGPDATTYALKRRGKRHDYFTSCLPWPQKGTAVSLPLGSIAPVKGIGVDNTVYGLTNQSVYQYGGQTTYPYARLIDPASANTKAYIKKQAANAEPDIYADLSQATAATINSIREAFQLQKLYERDARGGTRYTEIIRSHFGVTSPDFRQQRPEYLGGGSSKINIHPVAKTANYYDSTEGAEVRQAGELAAFGTVSGVNHGFTKSFTEHCTLIGLVNVRADLTYQQGTNRMWSRRTRPDFYFPALAHLGEQAVLNREIYTQNNANDVAVFGYQERYAEYRYKPSLVTGLFRSSAAGNLAAWHLSQTFGSLPALNEAFIQEDPPLDRCISVPAEPHIIFDSFIQLKCARPMPVYSVPGWIDHF